MVGNIDAYELLNAQCDAIDPQPLMSALRSATCPGEVEATAEASCRAILELDASTGSGVYWLRAPSGATYQAYCDMTTDGGGWTLIFSSNAVDGHDEEIGTLQASPNQATITPTTQQIGRYAVLLQPRHEHPCICQSPSRLASH